MIKSLKDISLPITEAEYRADGCMHYSTLAKYDRGGFKSIASLNDRIETPSLTNGSCVDAIITGGMQEFENNFMVAEFPSLGDNLIKIVKYLFVTYKELYSTLSEFPTDILATAWDMYDGRNWQAKTKANKIIEEGNEYYKLLYLAEGKTIISTDEYNIVLAQVNALKTSEATQWYFQENITELDDIERLYQLKFRTEKDGVPYTIMADLIICDYANKIIYPCDLKTSSHLEYEFYESFNDWLYVHQARLYWQTIRDNLDKDDYFKDFTLADYRFIVVNKKSLNPLVWEFKDTTKRGTLVYTGTDKQYIFRDIFDIGKELWEYLHNECKVPNGIKYNEPNDIIQWLTK